MKKLMLGLLAVLAALPALIVPSATYAHGGRHPHRAAAKHGRHAGRLERFGTTLATTTTTTTSSSATSTTTDTTTTQTTETSTSTSATESAPAPAGTVGSFVGGKLTVVLADGTSVSGMVTADTEIECQSPPGAQDGSGDGGSPGGPSNGNQGGGGTDQPGAGGDLARIADAGGDGGNFSPGQDPSCTSSDLVAGAVVQEAELRLDSGGAVWAHVDLLK